MEYETDLAILKNNLSGIPTQDLYNSEPVPHESIKILQKSLECYRALIISLYKQDNIRWAALEGIGLKELDDHITILLATSEMNLEIGNYNDCRNYLLSSIQDAIDTSH